MPNTIFSEKVEFLRIFLAAMLIPGILMIVLPFAMDVSGEDEFIKILLPIIGIIMLVLSYLTKTLDIVLTDEYLQFGFNIMRSKVNLSDIKEIRVEQFKFRNFGGYGIRLGRLDKQRVVGYIPKGGQGLLIKTTKKKNYFIISNRANELLSLINDRIRIMKKKKPEVIQSPQTGL